jgi:hypothetical protein
VAGRTIASPQYALWGADVSQDYLERGIPLTDSLRKVAQEQQLNPHQIRRVAEHANTKTFNELLPRREEFGGDPRFEPASADSVIAEANPQGKVAEDFSHYYGPPPKTARHADRVIRANFGSHLAKIASEQQAQEQEAESREFVDLPTATVLLHKLASIENEINLDRMDLTRLTKEALDEFKEIVRRMVLEGEDVVDMFKAACYVRPNLRQQWADLFGQIVSDLDHRGYFGVKTAQPLKPELISSKLNENLPANVKIELVNGKHPLTLSIDLLGELYGKRQEKDREVHGISDRIRKVREYMHNLRHYWKDNQTGEPMHEEVYDKSKPVKTRIANTGNKPTAPGRGPSKSVPQGRLAKAL